MSDLIWTNPMPRECVRFLLTRLHGDGFSPAQALAMVTLLNWDASVEDLAPAFRDVAMRLGRLPEGLEA